MFPLALHEVGDERERASARGKPALHAQQRNDVWIRLRDDEVVDRRPGLRGPDRSGNRHAEAPTESSRAATRHHAGPHPAEGEDAHEELDRTGQATTLAPAMDPGGA